MRNAAGTADTRDTALGDPQVPTGFGKDDYDDNMRQGTQPFPVIWALRGLSWPFHSQSGE